jgi:hypothetical protein
MKKRYLLAFVAFLVAFNFILAAEDCSPEVKLINQDPYPAIPGDYVKLVFQVDGIENPDCGTVSVNLEENFPFSLNPGETNPITVRSGVYERTFGSFVTVPYKVRVDENAIDGDNPIEILVSASTINLLAEFNISIEDARSKFEVFVKDFNPLTKIMTLEVLNSGKYDVKALTLEIPRQSNIVTKGANRNVLGDLDANEYTTADFEIASVNDDITLNIFYTDTLGIRRNLTQSFSFDISSFENRAGDQKNGSSLKYFIFAAVVLVILFLLFRRFRKSKKKYD